MLKRNVAKMCLFKLQIKIRAIFNFFYRQKMKKKLKILFEVLKNIKFDFHTSLGEYQNPLRIVKIAKKKARKLNF